MKQRAAIAVLSMMVSFAVTAEAADPKAYVRKGDVWLEADGSPARRITTLGNVLTDIRPRWSPDGKSIYFLTQFAMTSFAVHRFDVRTGQERFVIDAADLKVIQNGPYLGMLLVPRHTCHKEPGCDYPTSVVRGDGSVVAVVPGSRMADKDPAVSRWLQMHHWTAF